MFWQHRVSLLVIMTDRNPSLRSTVISATGQDVRHCQACLECDVPKAAGLDVPLGTLIQMVLYNDDEVLTSRTLWSESVLVGARYVCKRGLDLQAIMLALREEALRRGLGEQIRRD